MSLPQPPVARVRAHTRRIVVEGYRREDGLLELDASLTDVKDADYPLASGVRKAGEPVHLMHVRITIDWEFNILDAQASSELVPYPGGCDTIGPKYAQLKGLNLVRGFRRTVGEMFEGVGGCSHITELLFSLPTAAIQTFASFRRETDDEGSASRSNLIVVTHWRPRPIRCVATIRAGTDPATGRATDSSRFGRAAFFCSARKQL